MGISFNLKHYIKIKLSNVPIQFLFRYMKMKRYGVNVGDAALQLRENIGIYESRDLHRAFNRSVENFKLICRKGRCGTIIHKTAIKYE